MRNFLTGIVGIVVFIAGFLSMPHTFGATSLFITQQGGTGTSSPSGILYGDNGATNHLNTVQIGTNLTFLAGVLSATGNGGSGNVATSTGETAGQLAYWTSTNATPATLGKVATGTISASSPLSVTAGRSAVGGAAAFSITQAGVGTDGYLSSTDWNTFNNKQPAGTYVTSLTVASSNGFAGSFTAGATPVLTISTSITGVLKGNGTAISAAANGTDYTLITAKTCSAGDFVSQVTAAGVFTCTGGTGSFAYLFPIGGYGTSSPLAVFASTTIGNGTQANGLTVSGGATTTGNAYFGSSVGIGTQAPTHALTLANGSSIALYNTTDQTTNFERGAIDWTSNVFRIETMGGGTGSNSRSVVLSSGGANLVTASAGTVKVTLNGGTGGIGPGVVTNGSFSGASTNQVVSAVTPTFTQTGTSAYTALQIQPTETTLGSGVKYLIQAGTSTAANLFTVSNTGAITTTLGTPAGTFLAADPNGQIIATTTPSSGITSIGPAGQLQTGPAQTLATSTSAFNGLTPNLVITATGNTQTFTSSLSGKLAEGGGGTSQSTYSTGDILYASAANTLSKLTIGTGGFVLASANGIPTWVATTTLATISGQINLTTQVTNRLPFANLAQVAANSVLGNVTSATADAASVSTTSLYTGTSGQVLAKTASGWTGVATTTAGTGLSYNGTSFTVNTSQNIATLSNLTANGYVKTSGSAGTLSVQAVPIPIADGGTNNTAFTSNTFTGFDGSKEASLITTLANPSTGMFAFGTTTSLAAELTIASSTTQQLRLTSGSLTADQWVFRSQADGSLQIGTSTPGTGATSTPSAVQIKSQASTQVGIGTTTPWRTLSVTGTVGFDGLTTSAGTVVGLCLITGTKEVSANTGANCTVSSLRFKRDIATLGVSALDMVKAMRTVTYEYKDNPASHIGLIAEEIQAIDPRLVGLDGEGLPSSIDTEGVVSVLVAAVQELNQKIANIEMGKITRSVEENWQWAAIILLMVWNIALTVRGKR